MAEKEYFFDKPENVQRVLYVFYAICALLLVLDVIIHRHTYHPWERLIGFYPLYGFVGCVVLVLVAKWMRTFLMRDEDYYLKAEQARDSKAPAAGKTETQDGGH
jgi:hypothetical protein